MTLDREWSAARVRRWVLSALLLSGLFALVAVTDPDSVLGVALPLVTEVVSLAVFLVAAIRMRASRQVWWALWGSQVLVVAGDVIYVAQERLGDSAPFPGWADPVYLASYLLQFAAMAMLIRRRHARASVAQFLDSAIVSIPVVTVAAIYVLTPVLTSADWGVAELLAVAYPVLDLAVLTSLIRLAVGGGHHNRALGLLSTAVTATLVADLVYAALDVQGVVLGLPGWLNALFSVGVVLMTAAALSSDAPRIEVADRTPLRPTLSPGRLIALAAGAISMPLLILLGVGTGAPSDAVVLAGGAVAVNILIVWRALLVMAFIERQRQQLASYARTDALTGLPNRRSWDHEVLRAEAWAGQLARPLVVAMLDLDNFKQINDRRGHQAGDDVLRGCAAAWREALPAPAYLARYGGEEFAVLLADVDAAGAGAVLERVRLSTPEGVTVSIGYAAWIPGASVLDTLAAADAALYAAKAHGRDVVVGASVRFVPDDADGSPGRRHGPEPAHRVG